MRDHTIKIYQFDDLREKAKERAISDHIYFEIEWMNEQSPYYSIALEMERMRTPWFLASEIYHREKDRIIETIIANDYEFLSTGEIWTPPPEY